MDTDLKETVNTYRIIEGETLACEKIASNVQHANSNKLAMSRMLCHKNGQLIFQYLQFSILDIIEPITRDTVILLSLRIDVGVNDSLMKNAKTGREADWKCWAIHQHQPLPTTKEIK